MRVISDENPDLRRAQREVGSVVGAKGESAGKKEREPVVLLPLVAPVKVALFPAILL